MHIKEHHLFARIAAWILHSKQGMAITIGNCIYLHHATMIDLVNNERWLKHELTHVLQFQSNNIIGFIYYYIKESIRNGYKNNKYEIEAKKQELQPFIKIGYEVYFYN